MKKFLSISLFAFVLAFVSQSAFAQKYFTYDGETFSVLLKCSSDNAKVLEVSFSAKDASGEMKWNKFEIDDFEDMSNAAGGGFKYHVRDGKGVKFYVDYINTDDKIIVGNEDTGDTWTLTRRND